MDSILGFFGNALSYLNPNSYVSDQHKSTLPDAPAERPFSELGADRYTPSNGWKGGNIASGAGASDLENPFSGLGDWFSGLFSGVSNWFSSLTD